jgi:hypothetical protein
VLAPEFTGFGSGTASYFKFMKSMAWGFLAMSLAMLVPLLLNMFCAVPSGQLLSALSLSSMGLAQVRRGGGGASARRSV